MSKIKKARASKRLTKNDIEMLKRDLFWTDEDLQVDTLSTRELNEFFCRLTWIDGLHEQHNAALDKRDFKKAFELVAKIESEIRDFNAWTERH